MEFVIRFQHHVEDGETPRLLMTEIGPAMTAAIETGPTSPTAEPTLVRFLQAPGDHSLASLEAIPYQARLAEAEARVAETFGAERTLFLAGGAASAHHAVLLASIRPGDTVLVGRDVPRILLSTLILSGAQPVYLMPRLHPDVPVSLGIDPTELATALAMHPETRMVVLANPTPTGVTSEIGDLVRLAHRQGVPVHVDERWGSHFLYHPALPETALGISADAVITSTPELRSRQQPGVMLHLNGNRLDIDHIASLAAALNSSSPQRALLAGYESCRRLALDGRQQMERAIMLADGARALIRSIPGLTVLDHVSLGLRPRRYDATRLVIDVQGIGQGGARVAHRLHHEFGLQPEASDLISVTWHVHPGDTDASVSQLVHALQTLAREDRPHVDHLDMRLWEPALAPSHQVHTPRQALLATSHTVPIERACGQVSAELVIATPPGMPLLMPGELVTSAKRDALLEASRRGVALIGLADPRMTTVRVLD